jgi:lauroyl/myristoyl acyltransferase
MPGSVRALSLLSRLARPPALAAMAENAAIASPGAGRSTTECLHLRFARSRLAALRLLSGKADPTVVLGAEHLARAVSRRRGVLVVSAHIGCWELGAASLGAFAPVHSVAGTQMLPAWTRGIRGVLGGYGVHVHAARTSLRRMEAALRRGEIAALQMDGDQGGRRLASPFLGRRAALPAGAAWLAWRARPAVLAGACVWEGGSWISYVGPEVDPPGRPDSLEAWHERIAAEVEKLIRRWPDQWLLPTRILRWSLPEAAC